MIFYVQIIRAIRCKDNMSKQLNRNTAEQKHRYIMYLIKKVAKCVEGMGLKIMKFHAIMHMTSDIMNFGVPMEFDTLRFESLVGSTSSSLWMLLYKATVVAQSSIQINYSQQSGEEFYLMEEWSF